MAAMPSTRRRTGGFSLVEVAIALGVAASGLLVILALIASLLKQQGETQAATVALGLRDATAAELRRVGAGSISSLAARAAAFDAASSPLRLVSDRDGTDVREFNGPDGRSQFYVIELFQYPSDSALRANAASTFLTLQARVSWPFRAQGSATNETPLESREKVSFGVLIEP